MFPFNLLWLSQNIGEIWVGEREAAEAFPGLPQTSKMESFATTANG